MWRDRCAQGKLHVNMKAQTTVMHLQSRARGMRESLPPSSQKGLLTPGFCTSSLQDREAMHFCYLSHLLRDTLCWWPSEANAPGDTCSGVGTRPHLVQLEWQLLQVPPTTHVVALCWIAPEVGAAVAIFVTMRESLSESGNHREVALLRDGGRETWPWGGVCRPVSSHVWSYPYF